MQHEERTSTENITCVEMLCQKIRNGENQMTRFSFVQYLLLDFQCWFRDLSWKIIVFPVKDDYSYYFIILYLYDWTQLKSDLGERRRDENRGTQKPTHRFRITGWNWLILCKLCFSAHCSASCSTLTPCTGSFSSVSGAHFRRNSSWTFLPSGTREHRRRISCWLTIVSDRLYELLYRS